jgi:ABC-type multidrug transport system fused ATPase/permease subunit
MGLRALRSRIGMIPQEPILFEGTIRENIDYNSRFSDELIWEALDKVGLSDYVRGLSDKLESHIDEKGENLSFGQRQLLCLTSVILDNPKLVVLDEASSSLDTASDEKIQNIVFEHFEKSTVISIAHRLNSIAAFDKVMVLDSGKLIEFDSVGNLLANANSQFALLVEATGEANSTLIKSRANN